ncbi:acyl-CoA carboxylase subunit epsilon [Corynebacterium kroppenstedtii]|uniref:acyl-CoA carboxylase subunit epsilon n=1 Tax=Corynebacterium sp. PCR 32 TaxID=3351342 RepID=UPI00309C77CE
MTTAHTPVAALTILKGNPSDSDIAALTAVLTTMSVTAAHSHERVTRNDWGRLDEKLSATGQAHLGVFPHLRFVSVV